MKKFDISVLSVAPLRQGEIMKQGIDSAVSLAKAVDKLGYKRIWFAEHHNHDAYASAATVLMVQHILANTQDIRVGSGGIMLPNHSPLVVAEQFGTLETLYPNRVDLGLGRAPGTDQKTADIIRRSNHNGVFFFEREIRDILRYVGNESVQEDVRAYPGIGTNVPVFVLGSSTDSAKIAANLGLPYAFGAQFSPHAIEEALTIYRENFQPSAYLQKPYVIACINVIAADSSEEATYIAASHLQVYIDIYTNNLSQLIPPTKNFLESLSQAELEILHHRLGYTIMGDEETVRREIIDFQQTYQVDELIVISSIYDLKKEIHSYEILKHVVDELFE
ncbi:LLM class flavin-dependent oxidoreductase [Metabacillus halosaccharovorans]|uniref:LLM class flavin-dependent oxidoreductase n=1 Tax=Metabacillus halosaccharovorans TaxID=930124 RepID=UPI001C1F39B9|nr:LLM class flavin-dependent oxidoreductase [Metabacillus halosaccharovorans]MBU7591181.1 LLM class flavin-dependent oxidoreductase [Metabacillus halosaccharovorans]